MDNTIQLYTDEERTVKGYPITSPDRVIDEDGISITEQMKSINEQLDNIDNKISVNINDFKTNGETDTQALKNAMLFLSDVGGICKLNKGKIIINETIYVPDNVIVEGEGYSVSQDSITGTEIFKQFNGDGIILSGLTSKLKNLTVNSINTFGGDGVVLKAGRATVSYVSIFNQGNDGLRIGDDIGTPCNCWNCDHIITLNNKRNGVYINSTGGKNNLPDCNAGVFNILDSRGNGTGILIGNATDNNLIGICCQSNKKNGIEIQGKGNMLNLPYTESNLVKQILLTESSGQNYILGYRTSLSDDIEDNGVNNFILGRGQQTGFNRFKTPIIFDSLNFGVDEYKKGYWGFRHEANGDSNLIFENNGQTPIRHSIKHGNNGKVILSLEGLEIGEKTGQYIKLIKHLEKTITIPQLNAKTTANINIPLNGVAKRNTVIASPENLSDGLVYNSFISEYNTITLKITNITDNTIPTSNIVFSFDVICR